MRGQLAIPEYLLRGSSWFGNYVTQILGFWNVLSEPLRQIEHLFVTVKYGNYESLRLPWLNTNDSWTMLSVWVVTSIVDCHSHIQVALFCLLPIFTVSFNWLLRRQSSVRVVSECIIIYNATNLMMGLVCDCWSYLLPMTKINQNNIKQATDIFTWEEHETKIFSSYYLILESVRSHLS